MLKGIGLAARPQGRILPGEKGASVMRFAGQQVVITGAAGVYGRGLAEAFAREGAHLLLTDGDAGALAALAHVLPPGRAVLPGNRNLSPNRARHFPCGNQSARP